MSQKDGDGRHLWGNRNLFIELVVVLLRDCGISAFSESGSNVCFFSYEEELKLALSTGLCLSF